MVKSEYRQPCEEVLWHVLPSIRAKLARKLDALGFTQQKTAEKLGLTQAAVSQYINGKRANKGNLDKHTDQLLEKLAEDIKEDEDPKLSKRICNVCSYINKNPELLKECGLEKETGQEKQN